eukprot:6181666-Lingulodinium_polyedra.AAC.1
MPTPWCRIPVEVRRKAARIATLPPRDASGRASPGCEVAIAAKAPVGLFVVIAGRTSAREPSARSGRATF